MRNMRRRRLALIIVMAAMVGSAIASAPAQARQGAAVRPTADATRVPAMPVRPRVADPVELAALSSGQLTVVRVVGGLSSPLGIANAGDGTNRLFVVQRGGTVRVVQGKTLLGASFLNIVSKVAAGGERGLLGLAFHPDFEANGFLYVYYTRKSDGDIIVARYTANAGRTAASAATEQILLRIEHSANTNHNGGDLVFGPDGYLYIAVGDGGGSGDPGNNAQDKNVLLGKILRIDVDGTGSGPNGTYAIPSDNPFVGAAGLDEIWAYGLRNPWQISFDSETDRFWIADVGQNRYEEINREPARLRRRRELRLADDGGQSLLQPVIGLQHDRQDPADRRVQPRVGLLDHRRPRLPRAEPARPRWPVRLRRLLQRQDRDGPGRGNGADLPAHGRSVDQLVRRERVGRAVPHGPRRQPLPRHRPRVQRHRLVDVHRPHPLAVLRGDHRRLRQRPVLPARHRDPWRDGGVRGPGDGPAGITDRLLHGRQRDDSRGEHQPPRVRRDRGRLRRRPRIAPRRP